MFPDFRLKRVIITDLPTSHSPKISKKSEKTLKIIHKSTVEQLKLEDDFILEQNENYKDFLLSPSKFESGIKYDDRGVVIARSVVGCPQLFESARIDKLSLTNKETSNIIRGQKRFPTIKRVTSKGIDYNSKFKEKMDQINQNLIKEKQYTQHLFNNLRPDQKILYLKNIKALNTYDGAVDD